MCYNSTVKIYFIYLFRLFWSCRSEGGFFYFQFQITSSSPCISSIYLL
nr:MAG TPA: hypothetical protein [Caudoviricetes sp.]